MLNILFSLILGITGAAIAYSFSHYDLGLFLEGKEMITQSLFLVFLVWFINSFLTFLLGIKKDKEELSIVGAVFVLIILSLLFFTKNIVYTLIIAFSYLGITLYLYFLTRKRINYFTKFHATEVFYPLMKLGFMFLLVVISTLNFYQTTRFLNKKDNNFLTPSSFLRLTKPFVPWINKYLSESAETSFNRLVGKKIGIKRKDEAMRFIIKETLETMSEGHVRQMIGFRPDVIPVDKIKVYSNGEIEIEPALEAASPKIVKQINKNLMRHKFWLPFVVFGITAVLLLPLLWVFDLISYITIPLLFFIFLKTSVLKKQKEMREIEVIR